MTLKTRDLYASPNGDRWCLVADTSSHEVWVRHIPNESSGGRASDIPVGEFLVRNGSGPEKQELLRLIASLTDMCT